jgi:hypothetical protein
MRGTIGIHTAHVGIVHKAPSRFRRAPEWRFIAARFREADLPDPDNATRLKHNPIHGFD